MSRPAFYGSSTEYRFPLNVSNSQWTWTPSSNFPEIILSLLTRFTMTARSLSLLTDQTLKDQKLCFYGYWLTHTFTGYIACLKEHLSPTALCVGKHQRVICSQSEGNSHALIPAVRSVLSRFQGLQRLRCKLCFLSLLWSNTSNHLPDIWTRRPLAKGVDSEPLFSENF